MRKLDFTIHKLGHFEAVNYQESTTFLQTISAKGNTDTSRLLSGLVTISSGDFGAKLKNVGNLKAILI